MHVSHCNQSYKRRSKKDYSNFKSIIRIMYYCIWFCADFLCLAVFLFFKIKEGNWKNPSYLGKEVCNITTEVQFLQYFNRGMVFTIVHKGIFILQYYNRYMILQYHNRCLIFTIYYNREMHNLYMTLILDIKVTFFNQWCSY